MQDNPAYLLYGFECGGGGGGLGNITRESTGQFSSYLTHYVCRKKLKGVVGLLDQGASRLVQSCVWAGF
jgi:hypothetical protein